MKMRTGRARKGAACFAFWKQMLFLAAAVVAARFDETGRVVKEGAQVVLGANDKYIGLCRRHWIAGDLGPDFDIHAV